MTDAQNNIRLSPRLVMLWNQSHLEAGFDPGSIPDPNAEPRIALYPASFIERVEQLGFAKTRDFNFRGTLYIDEVTLRSREWVLDFAKAYFTESSFFQVTDRKARRRNWRLQRRHTLLGSYDRTFAQTGFVPRERPVKERDFFDDDYFRLICSSKFTLCPAGDAPWSMRFYEAIMSKSLPIVECPQHTGRNTIEFDIGYRYFRLDDQRFEYRSDWAEENFRKFLRFQTLTKRHSEGRGADSKSWSGNDHGVTVNAV